MISVAVVHGAAAEYLPVIVVLLLETLMTVLVFYGFWVSSPTATTQEFSITIGSGTVVSLSLILAPITGLGEQQICQDIRRLTNISDYTNSWILLLANIVPSKILLDPISYYDGNYWISGVTQLEAY